MAIHVNTVTAKNCIAKAIQAKLVPMLAGSPGIGKSAIIREIADEYNMEVIDLRLAQCDPTDLLGFPTIKKEEGKAAYLPMETFPLESDPLPEGKTGWLLFLDEFTSADRGVQKAAYKLVLDRMIGMYHLHLNCAIVCAGNLITDNAIVEEMSSALESRLVHLEMKTNSATWLDWANSANIDHRITSFIRFNPSNLNTFNPDVEDAEKTYACERTWHMAHKLLEVVDLEEPEARALLAGTISHGMATEFIGFLNVYKDIPSITEIERAPLQTQVPSKPNQMYAITGSIAGNINESNIEPLMQYLCRLPMEFQVVGLRDIGRRAPEVRQMKPFTDWIAANNTELF